MQRAGAMPVSFLVESKSITRAVRAVRLASLGRVVQTLGRDALELCSCSRALSKKTCGAILKMTRDQSLKTSGAKSPGHEQPGLKSSGSIK
jgi:hypothetical protein